MSTLSWELNWSSRTFSVAFSRSAMSASSWVGGRDVAPVEGVDELELGPVLAGPVVPGAVEPGDGVRGPAVAVGPAWTWRRRSLRSLVSVTTHTRDAASNAARTATVTHTQPGVRGRAGGGGAGANGW